MRVAAVRVAAVLVAAGSGVRLGAAEPKAFVELAGHPLVEHAVRRLLASGVVDVVVAVVPPGWVTRAQELLPQARVVAGGSSRVASVAAGLLALAGDDDVDVVLVHDAARCLAPPALVATVVAAVRAGHPAVVPGLPVADTVKQVDAVGRVTRTVDRSTLRTVQTPQGFARAVLEQAHAHPHDVEHTDDAGMAEACGTPVLVVPGDLLALKITTPADLAYAARLLERA